jgi:outer membrane receptor protein involved in Fe transport
MMNIHRVGGVSAAAILAAVIGWPAPASAQEALDEVIVSARKREESLQEVPLSVAVFDTEALRERNIQSVYDVATFTPNFNFTRNVVGRRLDAPSIRGQFTVAQNFGFEGNVAFYVDGAYISGTASGLTVDNLERVEVLRGPQVAQFGRGAFAGAINYVTKAPSADQLDGQVYLKAGEGSDFKTSGFLSGPLVGDRLLFFASASWESTGGEWRNSLNPCKAGQTAADGCIAFAPTYKPFWPDGQPVSTVKDDFTALGGESTWNVTGKLSWRALDNLTINVKADYTEADDEHYASLFHPDLNCVVDGEANWCGELKADGLRAAMNIADLREGVTSIYGTAAPAPFIGTQTTSERYLAEGLLDVGEWTVTALLTMNKQELESYRDLDRSPYLGPVWANLFTAGEVQRWDDHSAEVRAASPQDKPLRVSGGAYYFKSDNVGFQREFTGFCNRVEYGLPLINGQPSWTLNAVKENLAFFGGVDYDLGQDVTVSVEGRYAKDSPVQRAANGVTASDDYYSFSPRAIVKWQATEVVNLYASAAEGNKPGGFNFGFFDAPVSAQFTSESLANGKARVKEEKAWTYEVGAKTQWFDRRLTANVAAYYIDWTNQAVNKTVNIPWDCMDTDVQSEVPSLTIVNAAQSSVVGTEIEISLAATDNLFLTLSYGLQDTNLRKFVVDDLDLSGNARSRDFSGNEAPRVPKHSVTASATYRRPLGDQGADWFLRGDYVYNSKTWLDVDNINYVGDFNLLNARLGVDKGSWSAAFYVDNFLDEDTPLLATQFPNFALFPNVANAYHIVPRRGRNAGMTLTLRF